MSFEPHTSVPHGELARPSRWRRLPLRIRLIAGFAAAMLVVLTGAGAFVFLRVRYALDLRLNEELAAQSARLVANSRQDLRPGTSTEADPTIGEYQQVVDSGNQVLSGTAGRGKQPLLRPAELAKAQRQALRLDRGDLFPIRFGQLRIYATPIRPGTAVTEPGQPAVAIVAVRRDQRDEALRELIAQLVLANLGALAVASVVGYRLTRAALRPVERYRTEAARIAAGATDMRLHVPPGSDDEITRLGNTLNAMLTALNSALERERQFTDDASHELRTPLTLLATELELALRRRRSPAELEQVIRSAAEDTNQLIQLANMLLDTSATPATPLLSPVNLTDLLTTLTDRYQHTTTPEPLLHTEIQAGLVAQVDPLRITQAITNLIDNGIRHGQTPVTVTAHAVDHTIRIAVHDAGPGLPAAFLPHATERFTQADPARANGGTGLGLALVKAITDTHGGELRICSAGHHHSTGSPQHLPCTHPSAGTTTTLLIPVRPHSPHASLS